MNVREELNQMKKMLDVETDKELSDILNVNKYNLNGWIHQNNIPDKWRMTMESVIAEINGKEVLASLPLGDSHYASTPKVPNCDPKEKK